MKNALLVIDVQNIYSLQDSDLYVENHTDVVKNINLLVKKFKDNDSLIIYIKHIHKADGTDAGRMFDFTGESGDIEFTENTKAAEFIPELTVVPNAPIIIKNRYNSFINTNLHDILIKNHIEKVTICGFMTNFCCEMAARHAHDLDYYVDFIADATGTPGTEDLSPKDTVNATVATLSAGCANIFTTAEILK